MASLLYVCGLGLIFLAAAYWALQQAGVMADLPIAQIMIGLGALMLTGAVVAIWHRMRG